ncbi:MAG: hypothetical protein JWM39_810 [Parcubacteria group bacterium]|nr:hypothetical protein [Parcubacteria group bacterium]
MDNPERVTYFAATDSRGKRVPFGLKAKDRNRHMYVIGKTGMGKSTLLENMAVQDIRNGEGLAFIDPHGSAVEKLLEYVPEHRLKDVVYFAPFDLDQPIAFNIMEDVGYDKRHLVVSGLMATFKKIWEDAWSARMEYILTNTLLALLEYPGATLLGVNRMYTDKAYRKKVVDNIKDPVVKDFWTKEFANYGDRYTQEATPAIQNKIGQFTSNPLIRNIIGQEKSSFDIRELMDGKKILLINLSKGLVGDTNMRLLGSMLTTRIFLGAMSRAELDPGALQASVPFYFYVDEFQNFANETFAEILSEARKYNLNLIIAHQYVEQMEEQVRAAVFGNVGTTVAFRVGPFDAEVLETVFSPEFMKEDLVNLGAYQLYLSLMIDGVGSRPFSATTIPPIEVPARSFKKEVIEMSRQQFGNVRAGIEESILTELNSTEGENGPPEPPAKKNYSKAPSSSGSNSGSSAPRASTPRPTETRTPRSDENRVPRPSSDRPARANDDRPRPSEERPRRVDAPRPQQPQEERPRASTPRPAENRAPQQTPQKSSEDLKAILRGMSESAAKDKQQSKPQPKDGPSPLKGALADVLKKDTSVSEPMPAPAPKAPAQPQAEPAAGPYEVPEETLRSLFRDGK